MPLEENSSTKDGTFILLGSYADRNEPGIQCLHFDQTSGRLSQTQEIYGIENPSFLTVDASRGRLFAVSEIATAGAVVSFRYDEKAGEWQEISRQSTQGGSPCHVSLSESGKWLLVTNYESGSLCVFPVALDGSIETLSDFVQHIGRGVRPDRQEGPHPHSIFNMPGTRYWLVPDLGLDQLFIYELEEQLGKLILHDKVSLTPGAGPRHIAFHPSAPYLYVIQELGSSIAAFSYHSHSGKLTRLATDVSTLPPDFSGANTAADIHISPSGKYLYGSNRGHDSLAVYQIHATGLLRYMGNILTYGKTPRNFMVSSDGSFLLVGNQESHGVVVMRCGESGILEPIEDVFSVQNPTCIVEWQKVVSEM